VQELKVIEITTSIFQFYEIEKSLIHCLFWQKKLSTMTADEYFAKHPELKKKFDDEIRNDYWGYWFSELQSVAKHPKSMFSLLV
jgi:F-type H+-transporting ATPase subunit d